jgi:lipopolysaccharide transport system permease protein
MHNEGGHVSSIGLLSDEQTDEVVAEATADDRPETVIEARPGWQLIDLREIWRYRELLGFLTWRDIKVRYKQTVLGAAWAIIQPLATMIVFSLFIGRVGGVADKVEYYPLFVLAGLLPWTFFGNAITSAGMSLIGNQNLITKVYFPRLIIPVSAAGAGLIDFAIAFGLLAIMMTIYGVIPGAGVVLLPLVVLLLTVAALGVGILLAALTVAYRDFRYVIPFTIQLWMFATPSIYLPVDGILGPTSQTLLPLNPAYGLILSFRACTLGAPIDWYAFGVSGAMSLVLFVVGCFYFRRVERGFADII